MITIWEKPILATVNDVVREVRREIRDMQGLDLLKDFKMSNRNIMVTCPFHKDGKERNPSMGISTVETRDGGRVYPAGTCHCLTCGYTGELPEFISDVFGHGDRGMFGYKWITSKFASVTIEHRKPLKLTQGREVDAVGSTHHVTEEELESYRLIHPYMYFRKLTDKVIEYFDVGYDPKTDSLTFPVHDLSGNVPFVQRRSVAKKGFMNESIAAKGHVVYGLYHVYKNLSWVKEVVICESIIDALTCWVHRIPAVALMGALPTNVQLELLQKLPVRKYIVGVDNPLIDEAGKKGANRIADVLGKTKLVNFLVFPEGVKDINEMEAEQLLNWEVVSYRYFNLERR